MSTLTVSQRGLAVQLKQAGSKHHLALARVAEEFEISTLDAIDLALMQCHPQKVAELCQKGFKPEQICIIYDVVESYSQILTHSHAREAGMTRPSIRKLSDFAVWFLGVDFSEDELVEAIEAAKRIFPGHWKSSLDLSSEISYALGYGHSTGDHNIDSIEAKESERIERLQAFEGHCEEEAVDYSDHGQGDID